MQALAVLGALAVVCVLGALQLFVRIEPLNGSPKRYLKQMVVKRAVNHSPSNPAAKAPSPSPSPSQAPAPAPDQVVTATAFENNTKTHKKKPDVYFILDSANSVRKKHVQDMTNLLNSFDVHIWHSVPAETVGDVKYSALTSKKTFANVRRGAIGCALAHITLLQHISNQDAESALVFESDSELSNTFEQDFSQFVQHLPQNFEFGQLMHHKHMKKLRKSAKTINKHVMDSYAPYGTVGYYIMRSALKKLLPALIPITQPIDEMFRKVIKNRVVRSYMPKKDLITMPYKFDSTIWKTKIQAASKVLSEPKTDSPLKYSVPCNMFPDRWKTHGDEMVKILEMFHTTLEKLGIDYSLIGGSLLAYSRNNGQPMPWDDDLDVFIMPKNAPRVKAAIDASKDYCHASLWLGFKMFRCDSPRIGKYAWRYPMIDVFTTSKYAKLAAYLFPSQLATFAGIAIRIPKDPVGLTIDTYGKNSLETCKSSSWNHKMEKSFTKSVGFPCKDVMAQCHGKPTTPQKTDKTDEYEWQKNIDVVIPSSLGSSSAEVERSRTGDHSLYWVLISFSKHAPWVRNIYVYVNGKVDMPYKLPSNINVVMVDRCAYMGHCPTTNSQAVLTGVHRIPELSEHFISVQDDIILGRPATPSDFFTSEGKPYSWRKQPTWSDGITGAHHRVYVKPEVFNGKTPTSASPAPHFLYPMLKSFAKELAEEYSEWYAFVESHDKGRFSSQSNSINDKRNAQEECLLGVWSSTLITSKKGVYKNIDNRRGELWDEVVISKPGFAKAVRDKSMFMNVNDRFSKDPQKYKEQVQWFWDSMEELFDCPMPTGVRSGVPSKPPAVTLGPCEPDTALREHDWYNAYAERVRMVRPIPGCPGCSMKAACARWWHSTPQRMYTEFPLREWSGILRPATALPRCPFGQAKVSDRCSSSRQKLADALNRLRVVYFPRSGTELGIVRQSGFLSADGDIDIYVDMPQTMLFEKLDLTPRPHLSGKGVKAEVHWKDGDCPEVHLVYNDWISDEMQHRAGPDDLCLCQLNSVEFMCHKQARERMRVQYGPSWEIPLGVKQLDSPYWVATHPGHAWVKKLKTRLEGLDLDGLDVDPLALAQLKIARFFAAGHA